MTRRQKVFCVVLCLLLSWGVGCAQGQMESLPEKVVYLTFDDGPKADTPELLVLLDELDVPATFFFMGACVRRYPEFAGKVLDAGHSVGCHTMAHTYSLLKESAVYVKRDIERFLTTMRELVDPAFTTDLYRFPGGSRNYAFHTKQAVTNEGFSWFDWNSLTGDAHEGMTLEDHYDLAVKTSKGHDVVILLAHEGKVRTRKVLPDLVAYFRENGYVFRVLSTDEQERSILERSGAQMMFAQPAEGKAEGEMQ